MGVVSTLLKQVPAAAKFKPKLEALEMELSQLRAENARLQEALAQYIEQWETLDGPQVNTLQYLAANTQGGAAQIAKCIQVNIQIAETSLLFLQQSSYVQAVKSIVAGDIAMRSKRAQFCLTAKGDRYLRERGLHS